MQMSAVFAYIRPEMHALLAPIPVDLTYDYTIFTSFSQK